MITVTASEYGIKAVGHAGYAPIGQDIVCAAFTILMSTLAEHIECNSDLLIEYKIDIKPGYAEINCVPKNEYRMEIKGIFDVIDTGINILLNEYPKNVEKIL